MSETSSGPVEGLRISQLDAGDLNAGLEEAIRGQCERLLKTLPAGATGLFWSVESELRLALRAFLWWASVRRDGASLGQGMMGLRLASGPDFKSPSGGQLWAHFSLGVLAPYLLAKATDRLSARSPRLRRAAQRLGGLAEVASILHFLFFLRFGGPASLLERCLRLRPVHNRPPGLEPINLSFLSRELAWHGMVDVLALLLPLLNWRALRRRWKSLLARLRRGPVAGVLSLRGDPDECGLCGAAKTFPLSAPCGHGFCYYCAHQSVDAEQFHCPVCELSCPSQQLA